MKALQVLLPVVACLVVKVCGKIFSRCELASILKRWGMEGHQGYGLADWVCLAYFASGFNTATVIHNSDGSSEYGIFQINSRSWCADLHSQSKNLCNLPCRDLVTDEIIDDIICLKRASASSGGLEAWKLSLFFLGSKAPDFSTNVVKEYWYTSGMAGEITVTVEI